jgi:hypothetical protein
MNNFKILVSASLLSLAASSALAQTYGTWTDSPPPPGTNSYIHNQQFNINNNWSNLNVSVDTVGGDAVGRGSAAGNLLDVTTMNNTYVSNNQNVGYDAAIGSNINMDANKVWGSVGIQNQVVCNGISVSTDPVFTSVNSNQECHATDPYSQIHANISNVAGDAVVQGSALGNSLEADSNAPDMPILNRQINTSAGFSNITGNAYNVGGSVGFSSSAIGNSAQVIHYATH